MTQFEKGALFALDILKKVIDRRRDAIDRAIEASRDSHRDDGDLYQMLNGTANLLGGISIGVETKLLPALHTAQKEPSTEEIDQLSILIHTAYSAARFDKKDDKATLAGKLVGVETQLGEIIFKLSKMAGGPK